MKFKYINLRNTRNDEHFQFITELKDLVISIGAETIKISAEFQLFLVCYLNEDTALRKIVKSAITDDIENADRLRDITFRGMVGANTASLNHYDTNVAASARRLKVLFDTYGNLAAKPINEETSGIYNLVQELKGNYAQDVQKTGLDGWVDKLFAENEALEALVKERNAENAAKTNLKMKNCREETDRAYHAITERINALIVVEGPDVYGEFVNKMNSYIDRYNNTIAQRAGRSKGKKSESEL
jgi:hypothetical protein